MNNDENNNSLFDMYGVEQKEQENIPTPTPPANQIPTNEQSNEEVVVEKIEQPIPKPIPDEIVNEIKKEEIKPTSDDELLRLYIGPNYEKIVNGGYSYCSLIFGLYYFYYRKQHTYFLILLLIQLGIILSYSFLLKDLMLILEFISLIISFFIGINFKKEYVRKAQENIDKIKSQTSNIEEQKKLIKKVGGIDQKVFILIVLIPIISYEISILTIPILQKQRPGLFIHFPQEFKTDTTMESTSYKLNKYDYSDAVINHRTSDNVCNYKIVSNTEYSGSNQEELAKKYLKEKHSLDISLEEVNYGKNTYFYYYDEKEKTAYYVNISKKAMTEITVTYIKDENKKCKEYTEYILKNAEK